MRFLVLTTCALTIILVVCLVPLGPSEVTSGTTARLAAARMAARDRLPRMRNRLEHQSRRVNCSKNCLTPSPESRVRRDGTMEVVLRQATSIRPTLAPESQARLDGTMEAALRQATSADTARFVLLTFGNSAVLDHLRNFCHHATKAGIAHVVGAVDTNVYEQLAAQRTAAYLTPLALEQYLLDGANSHSSRSWKRFAAMRTGEVARMVALGATVLHTDTDVVWLRSPRSYLMCAPEAARAGGEFSPTAQFPCEALRRADIAVSSDNMGPGRAMKRRAADAAAGTFNSGILLIRPTAAGRRFAAAWHRNVDRPPRGSRFERLTSDQQVLNNMLRRERRWPGVTGRRHEQVMTELHPDWDGNLTLGALPLPLFANGHGYFVQRAHLSLGIPPFAVHATYSLDRHDGASKRQRFREAGLWAVDPPSFFQGRYLALNASLPPQVAAALSAFEARAQPAHNIATHRAALASYLAELRDALALSRALGRTLILPRWACYCDRLWAGSAPILETSCMYPASQDEPFLPFDCPMDHVLSPTDWLDAGLAHRDHSFLQAPQMRTASTADIFVDPPAAAGALHPGERTLPSRITDRQAVRLLEEVGHVQVLRLQHARGLLCGLESAHATSAFNELARRVLRIPSWCTRCRGDCRTLLGKWLPPSEIGSVRGNYWCMDVPVPARFQHGKCVLNT